MRRNVNRCVNSHSCIFKFLQAAKHDDVNSNVWQGSDSRLKFGKLTALGIRWRRLSERGKQNLIGKPRFMITYEFWFAGLKFDQKWF